MTNILKTYGYMFTANTRTARGEIAKLNKDLKEVQDPIESLTRKQLVLTREYEAGRVSISDFTRLFSKYKSEVKSAAVEAKELADAQRLLNQSSPSGKASIQPEAFKSIADYTAKIKQLNEEAKAVRSLITPPEIKILDEYTSRVQKLSQLPMTDIERGRAVKFYTQELTKALDKLTEVDRAERARKVKQDTAAAKALVESVRSEDQVALDKYNNSVQTLEDLHERGYVEAKDYSGILSKITREYNESTVAGKAAAKAELELAEARRKTNDARARRVSEIVETTKPKDSPLQSFQKNIAELEDLNIQGKALEDATAAYVRELEDAIAATNRLAEAEKARRASRDASDASEFKDKITDTDTLAARKLEATEQRLLELRKSKSLTNVEYVKSMRRVNDEYERSTIAGQAAAKAANELAIAQQKTADARARRTSEILETTKPKDSPVQAFQKRVEELDNLDIKGPDRDNAMAAYVNDLEEAIAATTRLAEAEKARKAAKDASDAAGFKDRVKDTDTLASDKLQASEQRLLELRKSGNLTNVEYVKNMRLVNDEYNKSTIAGQAAAKAAKDLQDQQKKDEARRKQIREDTKPQATPKQEFREKVQELDNLGVVGTDRIDAINAYTVQLNKAEKAIKQVAQAEKDALASKAQPFLARVTSQDTAALNDYKAKLKDLGEVYKNGGVSVKEYQSIVSKLKKEYRDATTAGQAHNKAVADGEAYTKRHTSAVQKLSAEMQKLNFLRSQKIISEQTYKSSVAAAEKEARGGDGGFLPSIKGNVVGQLVGYASGILSIGAAFAQLKSSVGLAVSLEKNEAAIRTFIGSGLQAKQILAELREFSSKGLRFESAQQGTKTLLQFGVTAKEVVGLVKQLGEIAGGDSEKFDKLALAAGQVKAAGKLMGQELIQLINAGFNPLFEISKRTGVQMSDLRKQMEEGKVGWDRIAESFKFATSEGGQFNGLLEEISGTTTAGKFNLLMNEMEKVKTAIGKNLTEPLNEVMSMLLRIGDSKLGGEGIVGASGLLADKATGALRSGDFGQNPLLKVPGFLAREGFDALKSAGGFEDEDLISGFDGLSGGGVSKVNQLLFTRRKAALINSEKDPKVKLRKTVDLLRETEDFLKKQQPDPENISPELKALLKKQAEEIVSEDIGGSRLQAARRLPFLRKLPIFGSQGVDISQARLKIAEENFRDLNAKTEQEEREKADEEAREFLRKAPFRNKKREFDEDLLRAQEDADKTLTEEEKTRRREERELKAAGFEDAEVAELAKTKADAAAIKEREKADAKAAKAAADAAEEAKRIKDKEAEDARKRLDDLAEKADKVKVDIDPYGDLKEDLADLNLALQQGLLTQAEYDKAREKRFADIKDKNASMRAEAPTAVRGSQEFAQARLGAGKTASDILVENGKKAVIEAKIQQDLTRITNEKLQELVNGPKVKKVGP
jgi:tape measure domain-containing protein